ncbi:MAG: TIR domain-containing protein, partial [Prevotella sp.]|nr:TIR domain-containing protein [Prevotella sp.]
MSKRIYISADYSEDNGDRDVVEVLTSWGNDNQHKVDFVDMAQVVSGSIAKDNPDCRFCDLKEEFNRQINASSTVVFIVGDKTASREAGRNCPRAINDNWWECRCTPYKQNANGDKLCKIRSSFSIQQNGGVSYINRFSFLRHEFEQAKKRNVQIIVFYNSLNKQPHWLPSYMKGYENVAQPVWTWSANKKRVG